ncbi:S-adenosyl-L-methionine-dependent methyltransferase [Forsythia ovata]|uniref:S-adenosyl-L-methionine-dependent methyltransferase n=1 Tax=Forsythia ovata TaxID=205694 RepID=A0ABD1X668_9LAMI
MDLKVLKWQMLHGSLIRRVVLKAFMFVSAMLAISFTQMAHESRIMEPMMLNFDECSLNFGSNPYFNLTGFLKTTSRFAPLFGVSPVLCKESGNLTKNVFQELIEKNLLDSNAIALCIGEGSTSAVLALQEMGFANAFGVERHPFFSYVRRRFVYELDYEDNHFDFVFSRDLDRVSVPALLILEIERILRPGGTGAMLVGAWNFHSGGLVRSATSVSSFLKSSDVVHVCGIGSFTLVIFKKRFKNFAAFEHYWLPSECPSVVNNKPFMKYIEPLVDEKSGQLDLELSVLPNFMNISSRNKLVYINVGAGEFTKKSIARMLSPYCSNHHAGFDVFVVDHRTSVLSSYVTDPGITFVYHPGLAGDVTFPQITSDEYLSAPPDEEGFNFIHWFNETVADGDFVVLMINANLFELNILVELFKSGAICRVDELYLRCSDAADCETSVCGGCMSLLKSLRNSGLYAHQWSGD